LLRVLTGAVETFGDVNAAAIRFALSGITAKFSSGLRNSSYILKGVVRLTSSLIGYKYSSFCQFEWIKNINQKIQTQPTRGMNFPGFTILEFFTAAGFFS